MITVENASNQGGTLTCQGTGLALSISPLAPSIPPH